MRVKIQFSQQKLFVLENLLPSFGKKYWTTLRGELLDNSPKQSWSSSEVICWTSLQGNSLENLPSKFLSQHFRFCFISCHAFTPNILGCPSAYGMHDDNSNTFMLIYSQCIYINIIKLHKTCYANSQSITPKLAHVG